MPEFINTIGVIVVTAAILTSGIAMWSLLPRPRRILRKWGLI